MHQSQHSHNTRMVYWFTLYSKIYEIVQTDFL